MSWPGGHLNDNLSTRYVILWITLQIYYDDIVTTYSNDDFGKKHTKIVFHPYLRFTKSEVMKLNNY